MREVGVLEAKTKLSSLIAEVEAGEDVVITRNGRPVVRVVRFAAPARRLKLSGDELVARAQAFQRRLIDEGRDTAPVPWEEIKEQARR